VPKAVDVVTIFVEHCPYHWS